MLSALAPLMLNGGDVTFKTRWASVTHKRSFRQDRVDRCRVTRCKRKIQWTIKQQYAIKLCVSLGKSNTETLGKIRQVFKKENVS